MSGEQRRHAAILVADVVGFSRLVGADEIGTLARLAALRARSSIRPSRAIPAGMPSGSVIRARTNASDTNLVGWITNIQDFRR